MEDRRITCGWCRDPAGFVPRVKTQRYCSPSCAHRARTESEAARERGGSRVVACAPPRFTPEQLAEMRRLRFDEELSLNRVARAFGTYAGTVKRHLERGET